ncbi:Uncharacterised protein [Staphylococcus gallinarum]|uniref:Uncharacterized protein n=1 Tax=Staphylococcus gallinarum TaxID=1293 RepID=A0A380FEZ8_STAGA|nr:Uncharacterised protein [Staphylococcus gallinarum]
MSRFQILSPLFPYKNETYPGWTPRALSISAYTNVSVNNFTAIGDGTFDSTSPAIAVQFYGRKCSVEQYQYQRFQKCNCRH